MHSGAPNIVKPTQINFRCKNNIAMANTNFVAGKIKKIERQKKLSQFIYFFFSKLAEH